MWVQIVLLTFLQFLFISSRSIDPEGPFWLDRFNGMLQDVATDDYFHHLQGESDTSNKEKKMILASLKTSSEKRALSMFARWGPINTIGKERNPIRSGYPPNNLDSISAQTRSRMLGQPLRWG